MIGVLCADSEKDTAREFFQLFKTPWEFYREEGQYAVVIASRPGQPGGGARLSIQYSSAPLPQDASMGLRVDASAARKIPAAHGTSLPIYGKLASLRGAGAPVLRDPSTGEVFAVQAQQQDQRILRIGFNLFGEAAALLTGGQPAEQGLVPALELHIALLREWMLDAGIAFVEIPPAPFGYAYFACLTHDVDFAGIRRHFFDHTMWGFVYRGLFGSLRALLVGKTTLKKAARNWSAVMRLPLVYLGLVDDYWEHFDRYAEIDRGAGSTYFLLPFKNTPGQKAGAAAPQMRAARYGIEDVREQVAHLQRRGAEICLHGIDAWHSPEAGQQEKARITAVTGQEQMGTRIHWLYYDAQAPCALEQAGFDYDASLGYNEAVGFKNGTTQVFRPFGAQHLLELPLIVQDTALFYPRRMGLRDADAEQVCGRLLEAARLYQGVLTLSWHDRSLAPERLWGDFYRRLLGRIERDGAWVGSAGQVVRWFRQRRSVVFEAVVIEDQAVRLKVRGGSCMPNPPMFFRFHLPGPGNSAGGTGPRRVYDIPWRGEEAIEVLLDEETGR